MNKIETIETIDCIIEYLIHVQSVIDMVGRESDYVYQAKFSQFIIELDKVAADLIDLNDEIGD